jgi:hypothetical protein
MTHDKKNKPEADDRHEYIPGVQEKSTIGGDYNTGVTSQDPEEKQEIEKRDRWPTLSPAKTRKMKVRIKQFNSVTNANVCFEIK